MIARFNKSAPQSLLWYCVWSLYLFLDIAYITLVLSFPNTFWCFCRTSINTFRIIPSLRAIIKQLTLKTAHKFSLCHTNDKYRHLIMISWHLFHTCWCIYTKTDQNLHMKIMKWMSYDQYECLMSIWTLVIFSPSSHIYMSSFDLYTHHVIFHAIYIYVTINKFMYNFIHIFTKLRDSKCHWQ